MGPSKERIGIHQQDPMALDGQPGSDMRRQRGFANAAFLIQKRNHFHVASHPIR
jgi:hypothetical protein